MDIDEFFRKLIGEKPSESQKKGETSAKSSENDNPSGWGSRAHDAERLAISGAGGDPDKDGAIVRGTYFDEEDYRPNLLNEPRPEEQISRNFSPAWDTTFGGPHKYASNPRPSELKPRQGGAAEAIATSMANDLTQLKWAEQMSRRRIADREQNEVVRNRATANNAARDQARPPMKIRTER
jgi:hypothetical protein